jgi:hypothetical protein
MDTRQFYSDKSARFHRQKGYSNEGLHPSTRSAIERWLFPHFPDVEMKAINYFWSDPEQTFSAKDCYLIAEASITAGMHPDTDCNMTSTGSKSRFATCSAHPNEATIDEDWLPTLTLDTISEVIRYLMVLSIDDTRVSTQNPWLQYENDFEAYTTGMLRLAYHSTWSSVVRHLSRSEKETISITPVEDVVLANVDRSKMNAWLAMKLMLTLAAILVYVAQIFSVAKTIRNPTLAVLTMDLSGITHSGVAPGLCNAVELDKQDKKLGRLRWEEVVREDSKHGGHVEPHKAHCRRRVVLEDQK